MSAAGDRAGLERRAMSAFTRTLLASTRSRLSLAFLSMLALVAVFADVLANDWPLVARAEGRVWILPSVTEPAELVAHRPSAFGGEPGTWALFPPIAESPSVGDAAHALAPPMRARGHLLGTDRRGRDVLARLVHGTRTSLLFAISSVLAYVIVGVALGTAAGHFGGGVDSVVARVVETLSSFPPLVLALGVQAAAGRATFATLFSAIALAKMPEIVRIVRAEVVRASSQDYAMAARALGASPTRVLLRHIAPNVAGPVAVAAMLGVGSVILLEASLDFLRVGVPEHASSWGQMMSEIRDEPSAWWLLASPALVLFGTVLCQNVVGASLRDALDPRTRETPLDVRSEQRPDPSAPNDPGPRISLIG